MPCVCIFVPLSGAVGGGLYVAVTSQPSRVSNAGTAANVAIAVTNSTITGNRAVGLNLDTGLTGFFTTGGGGGVAAFLGNFAVANATSVTIAACVVDSNAAVGDGGAVVVLTGSYDASGSISTTWLSPLTLDLKALTLWNNTCGGRGGAVCVGTLPDIQRSSDCPAVPAYWNYSHDYVIVLDLVNISDNVAGGSGGGVWVGGGGAIELVRTSVVGNTAGNSGGGRSLGNPSIASTCSLKVRLSRAVTSGCCVYLHFGESRDIVRGVWGRRDGR